MSFEAHIKNIHAKTGKLPRDFYDEAVAQGEVGPRARASNGRVGSISSQWLGRRRAKAPIPDTASGRA